MADNTESTIEPGGTEETVGLMVPDTTEDEGASDTSDITPSNGRLQYIYKCDVVQYVAMKLIFLTQMLCLCTNLDYKGSTVKQIVQQNPQIWYMYISCLEGVIRYLNS